MTKEEEQIETWNHWVSTLPQDIQKVAKQFVPWKKYRLKTTDQICKVLNFQKTSPEVTLTVLIWHPNPTFAFEREVKIEELEELI